MLPIPLLPVSSASVSSQKVLWKCAIYSLGNHMTFSFFFVQIEQTELVLEI